MRELVFKSRALDYCFLEFGLESQLFSKNLLNILISFHFTIHPFTGIILTRTDTFGTSCSFHLAFCRSCSEHHSDICGNYFDFHLRFKHTLTRVTVQRPTEGTLKNNEWKGNQGKPESEQLGPEPTFNPGPSQCQLAADSAAQ